MTKKITMKIIFTSIAAFVILGSFTIVKLRPVDNDNAVTFTIKNFGINSNGELKGLKGTVSWEPANPGASYFNVSVDASTINTGIDSRDNHLRSEEYLNVAKFPTLNFVSTAVTAGNVTGNLTIKGVTKQINFPFTVTPSGSGYMFEGNFTINRRDYGVGGNSMVLSDVVNVHLKVPTTP